MTDPRDGLVDCETHGTGTATFVCRHLVDGLKGRAPAGFMVAEDAHGDRPDAWCDACERMRREHGGEWTDASEAFAGVTLLCSGCYDDVRAMNRGRLSLDTRSRLHTMFGPSAREEAERLLVERCGNGLPSFEAATPQRLERVRLAALKQSGGSLEGLRSAVDLANADWRDLLVFAGFGHDVDAHRDWWPE